MRFPAEADALLLRRVDPLPLTLADEFAFGLRYIAEKLKDYVGDKGSGQITPVPGESKGMSSTTIYACFSFVISRHCSRISS